MPSRSVRATVDAGIDPPIVLTSHSFALSEVAAHSAEMPADYLLKYAFHPMNVVMDNVATREADHVIAISEEMRDQLVSRYGLSPGTVTTISHGVDTGRYRPHDERHPAVSDDRLTLLFVGRLITRKGVDVAIRTLAATDEPDVELLIAGTGRLAEKLSHLSHELGVSDRVQFLGYVPDSELPLLYSSADVTVFASNYEGFGLVVLESMACGTPVIGPPVGGLPDVVTDEDNGFIVSRSPNAIANRIQQLHDDPELLDDLSAAALATASAMTWEHVAEQVETVYNAVR